MDFIRLFILFAVALFALIFTTSAKPTGTRSQEILEHMREIPQWHCLRYRKFDLVKRCRNYRAGLKNICMLCRFSKLKLPPYLTDSKGW